MAHNLVIVESPAKASTIEKYLGSDYQVIASMGHVRDLPSSKLGVDVENAFAPSYLIPAKARPTVKKLKDALKNKKAVYLATDLDREGEAIAWHIAQALDLETGKLQVHRITFDEITKSAVTAAIANPRDLNYELIDAQQARRVLDRLVGYTLSPVLWKKVYKGLSAGRVQSAALRLVVDREREREAFKAVEYWSVKAKLGTGEKPDQGFTAQLAEWDGKKIEQQTLGSEAEVNAILAGLEGAAYAVNKTEKKTVKRRPPTPYTTSTLQQDAVNKLRMSAKSAMRAAQKLYEAGHITYMRTDALSLSEDALRAIRAHLQSDFGAEYLPAQPNRYKTQNKQAQEAHEAIRPTDPTKDASQVSKDPQEQKVYDLIRRRTLASQMTEAQIEQTALVIGAGKGVFRATGQRILFPGFLKVWGNDDKDGELLPELNDGQALILHELLPEQHFTEPPARFTEASLIKALEELGIGRPSTYAPTIDTLVQRNYVQLEQRRLMPEEVGKIVTDLLKEHFPNIVDFTFTANMEEQLDQVAEGKADYKAILRDFWGPFHTLVEEKSVAIPKIDLTEESDVDCPTCGKKMMVKTGRFGKFLACSGFPDCKTTQPLNKKEPTGLICPIDGKPLLERRARRGIFYGCSGYPDCTFAVWKVEQLPAKIEETAKEGTEMKYKQESLDSLTAFQNARKAA